jgi:hypothetical protein
LRERIAQGARGERNAAPAREREHTREVRKGAREMRHVGIAVVLLAALIGCSQPAQSAEMKDLLSGEKYALTLQMKNLDGQWRRLSAGGAAESGGIAQVYAAMFGGGGGVYYTKGETVSVATETYLIAYALRSKPVNYMTVMRGGPGAMPTEELTAESPLGLSLLNLRAIGSLTDIRQFNLEEEIAAHAEMLAATEGMMSGGGGPPGGTNESLSNLKNIALALQMFVADYDDVMPDMTDMVAVMDELGDYVRNDEVFFQPDTGQAYGVNSSLSQKRLAEIADPVSIAVFYEEEPGDDGMRGVAFLDGHAARVSPAQWEDIKAASGME